MKKIYRILTVLLLCSFSNSWLYADVYKDAYRQVEQNNPSLMATRADNVAEIMSMRSENNIPDPEVEFEHVWAARSNDKKWNFNVAQSFDFPGVYSARAREIAVTSDALMMKYKAELTDCLLQVTEVLINIAYCNRAIELQQSVVKDMESINTMLNRAFDHGESTVLEMNRARIEYANSILTLNDLKSERDGYIGELTSLGALLNASEVDSVVYPMLRFESRDSYMETVANDPLVNYYVAMQKARLAALKVNKLERLPGLKIGYVYEFEEGMSFNGFSVGLTLPFFSTRHKSAANRALVESASHGAISARIERESAVDVAYSNASVKKNLYDTLAPLYYDSNNLLLLEKAFKGGQLSAIDYLREVDFFRESELEFLNIERDYHIALARLDKFDFAKMLE